MLRRIRLLFALVLLVILIGAVLYISLKEETDGHKAINSRHHVLEHSTGDDHGGHDFRGSLQSPLSSLRQHGSIKQNNPSDVLSEDIQRSEEEHSISDGLFEDDFEEASTRDLIEKAYRRSMEYCNPVDHKTTPDEGNVSDSYKLQSVYVVIRHGDRSPMYKLPNQDWPKLSCLLDTSQNIDYSDLLESFFKHITLVGHRIKHNHIFGLYPHQKSCMGAQLTGRGAVQHLVIGNRLKNIYMKTHNLLSRQYFQDQVDVKTTDYSRTYQSAIAFLYGILPEPGLQKMKIKVTDNVHFCDEHGSGVSCNCPVTNHLKENAKKEENRMKSSVTSDLMNSVKREIGDIYGLNTQQIPWIGGIIEVLMGYVCHDLPLPCNKQFTGGRQNDKDKDRCIRFPLIGKMWEYLDSRGEILLSGHADHKYNLLLIYPLLREIAQAMQNVTVGQTRTKLTLYSGHDLTMRPLAKALGIYDGRWPPYASRLVFELYTSSDNQYYIRVVYNGDDKTNNLKFCEDVNLHDGLCPLTNFVDFAFHEIFRTFGKQSYKSICNGK